MPPAAEQALLAAISPNVQIRLIEPNHEKNHFRATMNPSELPAVRYKLHWHVFLTHFPLSLIGVAFVFQVLHLYAYPQCFELASTVVLIAGVALLVPTTVTGYFTWKRQYHGVHASIFRRKVVIALALLMVGVPLCVWRIIYIGPSLEAARTSIHWGYFLGTAFMIVGAIAEGYYGGRLSHRPRVPFQKDGDAG